MSEQTQVLPEEVAICGRMLKASRPSMSYERLLKCGDVSATFEQHFPHYDMWVYTVNHSTVEGNCIVVTSKSPNHAEQIAQEALDASMKHMREYANTGLQAEMGVREATPMH